MAKLKIKAKTFNGEEIMPTIEVFIKLNKSVTNLIPLKVESEIKQIVKEKTGVDNIEFNVISKDLEDLINKKIELDSDDLILKLSEEVIIELNDSYQIEDDRLKRIRELLNFSKDDAYSLLKEIDIDKLSKYEKEEYYLLNFKLSEDKDNLFNKYKDILSNNPDKLKELYFDYIKYLEDKRDEKKPYKLIKEFMEKFPIDFLNQNEKMIFYYLKGRNYYYRGEYILAIDFLSKAKELNFKNEQFLSNIFNSSANIFTDNLFFEEALELANKALDIRKKLKLNSIADTISLLGNIYFKKSNYKKSYNYFKEVLEYREDDRIYNYLAKTSIELGYFIKANEFLKKSENLKKDDRKGFRFLIYSYLFLKENRFDELYNLYKSTLEDDFKFLKFDKFVIGWFYVNYAESLFKQNNSEGINFIYKAIQNFLDDNYILESYYVSLIPYLYGIEDTSLLEKFKLESLFDNYVRKHLKLLDYKNFFELGNNSNKRLSQFLEDTKQYKRDLNSLKKIMLSINLR